MELKGNMTFFYSGSTILVLSVFIYHFLYFQGVDS